ncbi:MAG: hypothetical protein JKY37_19295 [Nannocystaceae bacterium]|nr:hypothetical protein [Nannocystaceae bacterium]
MRGHTVVACLVGLFMAGPMGCDKDKDKDKDKVQPREAAKTPTAPAPNPHKTVEAMAAQKPALRSQDGSFDLTVDETTTHLPVLPFGQNSAVYFEGKKGRITVAGSSQVGYPSFRAEMVGWRLDELTLPMTLTGSDKQLVRFRYQVTERVEYKSDDAATRRGENEVTLLSYEGNVLTGTFAGTVAPKSKALGEPMKVSGKFKTTLRLKGVERASDKSGADAEAAQAGETDG